MRFAGAFAVSLLASCAFAISLLASCTFSIDFGSNVPIDAADAPLVDMPIDEPVPPDPCTPVQVAASSGHNCARMSNGDVWCWGMNDQGQVGRPAQRFDCNGMFGCNPMPEKIAVTNATGMGMGDKHACILVGNTTYCMGANDSGQFGDNNSGDSYVPIVVAQRANALEIVGGETHTCSRHGNELRCSGQNSKSECGDGSLAPHFTPFTTLGSGVDAVGTGYQHACIVDDHFVYCWGENSSGQTGQAGSIVMTPQFVRNVNDVTGIAGGLFHTCAVQQSGSVRCWGGNDDGQLGIGNTDSSATPVQAIVAGIVQISAGVNHTCALAAGGTVYCWGEGYTPTPTAVSLPGTATQIASGSYHDCFVLAPSSAEPKGSVWCTGANPYGQLGRGGNPGGSHSPGPVALCQ